MAPIASIPQRVSFLDFPYEIREHIYQYSIPQDIIFDTAFGIQDLDDFCPGFPFGWVYPTVTNSEWDEILSGDKDREYFTSNHCIHYDQRRDVKALYKKHGRFYRHAGRDFDYYRVCPRCRAHHDYHVHKSAFLSLVLTCRQVCLEVESLFYGQSDFLVYFDLYFQGDFDRFSPRLFQKIRTITLLVDEDSIGYFAGTINPRSMNKKFWKLVGPGLKTLKIIMDLQAEMQPCWRTGRVRRWVMHDYLRLIGPTLKHLGRVLGRQTQIIVDTNGNQIYDGIFEKKLPQRCSFEPVRFADCLFWRADFRRGTRLRPQELLSDEEMLDWISGEEWREDDSEREGADVAVRGMN